MQQQTDIQDVRPDELVDNISSIQQHDPAPTIAANVVDESAKHVPTTTDIVPPQTTQVVHEQQVVEEQKQEQVKVAKPRAPRKPAAPKKASNKQQQQQQLQEPSTIVEQLPDERIIQPPQPIEEPEHDDQVAEQIDTGSRVERVALESRDIKKPSFRLNYSVPFQNKWQDRNIQTMQKYNQIREKMGQSNQGGWSRTRFK